jgi:hypothetical protein
MKKLGARAALFLNASQKFWGGHTHMKAGKLWLGLQFLAFDKPIDFAVITWYLSKLASPN